MSARRQRLEGSLLATRFLVCKQIGVTSGVVSYDARDMKLGRSIVVKLPYRAHGPTTAVGGRLMREAKAAARVDHPNVLAVLDFGTLPDGTPYLVTESPVGESLRARIERERHMLFRDIIDISNQILSGLGAAHESGFAHGNLTAESIHLANRRGCAPLVKILGFGVGAGIEPTTDEGTKLHPIPRSVGGPRRRASSSGATPAMGHLPTAQPLDPSIDIYACGALMFEMCTGQRPEAVGGPEQLLTLRHGTPQILARIVSRAMAPRPENRFPTAFAVQETMRLVGVAPSTASTPPPPMTEKRLPDFDEWDDTTNERPLY